VLRVALKGLLGHKLRFVLTMVAVVLGVTFVSGTFVLTDSINQAFEDLFGQIYESADVYVAVEPNVESGMGGGPAQAPGMPESVADDVAAIDGVAEVVPNVSGFAQVLGEDGEPVANTGAPTIGINWSDQDTTAVIREGRAPRTNGEVVVDHATFVAEGMEVGQSVTVVTVKGLDEFTLVGSVGVGELDSLMGATLIAFTLEDAQAFMDREGEFNEMGLIAQEGVSAVDLRDRVLGVLGDGYRVQTADERATSDTEQVASFLGFLNTALLTFAGIALFVGSFIIANTFSIVVAQRSREFALLRAVGASTRQVQSAVLVEALVVGLLSGVLGLGLGVVFAVGLQSLMAGLGLELPPGNTTVEVRTIVAALTVGIGVTVVASIVPARRASRVAPVEAMRGSSTVGPESLGRRTAVGVALTVVGGVAIVVGLAGSLPQPLTMVGLGAALLMLGVSLAAPLAAGPIATAVGWVPSRFGVPGRLARRNAVRDRRRTATTASALMIGLALVALVAILAASIRGSLQTALDETFRADFIVATDNPVLRNLPPGFANDLAERPEIGAVTAVRIAPITVGDTTSGVTAVTAGTLDQTVALGEVEGDPTTLGFGDVFISTDTADGLDLAIGDTVTADFPLQADVELTVIGTYSDNSAIGANWLMSLDGYEDIIGDPLDAYVYATSADGVDDEVARVAVDEVAAAYPGAEVRNQAEFREEQEGQINQLLALISVLLLLSVIVAILGIANTLALSVFERTREIGLLRAVGMDRPQARRMIGWESVIVAVFGAVLGMLVGIFLGWAVVNALKDEGITTLVIPGGQLVAGLVGAGFAGILAAVFPAIRASRLDVLQAVTTE
jgi:putative ABC transport system permease protein